MVSNVLFMASTYPFSILGRGKLLFDVILSQESIYLCRYELASIASHIHELFRDISSSRKFPENKTEVGKNTHAFGLAAC
jgi:hypothetical protein